MAVLLQQLRYFLYGRKSSITNSFVVIDTHTLAPPSTVSRLDGGGGRAQGPHLGLRQNRIISLSY